MSLLVQLGFQFSGWNFVIFKQIFVLISNLPLGVRKYILGGLKGYSTGNSILP